MEKIKTGAYGETLALAYLLKSGYVFVGRNVRFGHHEIDLIVKKENTTVFVEVKARSSIRYGLPREAVSKAKQNFMIKAAKQYMRQIGREISLRFDVVEVYLNDQSVIHLENAFTVNS